MRVSQEEYDALIARRKDPLQKIGEAHGLTGGKVPAKASKYRNQKVTVDGITFDSKWEATCWHQLKLEERTGAISGLQRQVPFELIPPQELDGKKLPATRYVADFVYTRDGRQIVADAKGMASLPEFKIKKKLMKWIHGINITEMRK